MLFLVTLFLLAAVTFAATRNLRLLMLANATCFLCIPFLSAAVVIRHAEDTFTGAAVFPVAVFGLTLQYLIHGAAAAQSFMRYMLFALLIVFGSMFLLECGGFLSPYFDAGIRIVGVQFVCLHLMQTLFVCLLERPSDTPALLRIPLITAMMHIAEGTLFYPCIALGKLPSIDIVYWTVTSVSIRLVVVLISLPFLALVLRLRRQGLTPMPMDLLPHAMC